MTALLNTLRQATTRLLWHPSLLPQQPLHTAIQTVTKGDNKSSLLATCQPLNLLKRFSSSYNPYPNFEKPSPYKKPAKYRHGYQYKYYKQGILPRPKGAFEDKPLPYEPKLASKRNAWTKEKALFGQNDYIDILGDGTIHPSELMEGPRWLRAFKGNEFQRLLRQLEFNGHRLKEQEPEKYKSICKKIWFLYKKLNRRRHAPFWGQRTRAAHSRIDRVAPD